MQEAVLRDYVMLLRGAPPNAALLVKNERVGHGAFAFAPVLEERIPHGATAICFAVDPHPRTKPTNATAGDSCVLALTVAACPTTSEEATKDDGERRENGEGCAVRVVSTVQHVRESRYENPGFWLERLLVDRPMLATVREAWLVDPAAVGACDPESWLWTETAVVQTLAALPALRKIVLVVTEGEGGDGVRQPEFWPDLSLLPRIRKTSFKAERIRLQLVCFEPPSRRTSYPDLPGLKGVNLSRMLKQLATSAYCYLNELVVQLGPTITPTVDAAIEEQLRGYFASVRVERIYQLPQMPLPLCCTEEDDGPGGSFMWTASSC